MDILALITNLGRDDCFSPKGIFFGWPPLHGSVGPKNFRMILGPNFLELTNLPLQNCEEGLVGSFYLPIRLGMPQG